jgi:hypothetical protein
MRPLRRYAGMTAWLSRFVRAASALASIVSLSGCQARYRHRVPQSYRYTHGAPEAAPPALDWWHGFRSAELTSLMEEAQAANLDIAVAIAQILQADAPADRFQRQRHRHQDVAATRHRRWQRRRRRRRGVAGRQRNSWAAAADRSCCAATTSTSPSRSRPVEHATPRTTPNLMDALLIGPSYAARAVWGSARKKSIRNALFIGSQCSAR